MYKAQCNGSTVEVATITEARQWAEEFGTTANRCEVTNALGRVVAVFCRETDGDGRNWYRAAMSSTH